MPRVPYKHFAIAIITYLFSTGITVNCNTKFEAIQTPKDVF